jgi:poly-gamma-glutamate capsule biosynthesis protein CapA/YwtB (metallophosphatase superfamily)
MDGFDIVFTGDLILDETGPDHWLGGIAPTLRSASLAIGHLEVPHTRQTFELKGDVPAPGAAPEHLAALQRAGVDAVTLAGNHIADCGPAGIADTITELRRLGIASCGAGADWSAAVAPAHLDVGTARVALLSYNCVGPESSWATDTRAGCAYVRIETADGRPVAPATALLRPDSESLAIMTEQIQQAKHDSDLVIVALHKGIVHTPATLAPYERPLAHAAIDAGADVVIGHHAHILRGVEIYRGKPIYHGLGNGCVVTRALSPSQEHPARAQWARKRREMFGFEPDPAYELAPFHPEAVNAVIARLTCSSEGRIEFGFIPVYVEAPGRPIRATGARAQGVADYLACITGLAGLPDLEFEWRDDMVRILT